MRTACRMFAIAQKCLSLELKKSWRWSEVVSEDADAILEWASGKRMHLEVRSHLISCMAGSVNFVAILNETCHRAISSWLIEHEIGQAITTSIKVYKLRSR